jgi:alpha-1,2-mannosyltransferase
MLAELAAPWATAGRLGRWLRVLGLIVSAVAIAFNFWIGDQADWVNYASAVDRVLRGESLYSAAQLGGTYNLPSTVRIGYSYPPASILLFLPFAVIPAGVAIYTVASAAVFLSGMAAVVRREFGHISAGFLGIALIAVVPLPGYLETLRYSNVNLFIAGVFAWLWALPKAERAVGAGLAASILLKIFPGFFLGWSVRHVGWRHAAWTVAVVVVACVAALPLTGPGAWGDYVTALANAEPSCGQAPSLTCALQPMVGLAAAKAIALGVAILLALASVLVPRRLLGYALLVGAVHAPVLELWGHYELFPFVLGVVAVCHALARRAQTSLYSPSTASSASVGSPSADAPSAEAPSPEAPSGD